ncbi:hypothetical protein DY000_02018966 [Brassica cretica]|uniref:Uncharacterized protein n=1 Tax=Brassica cretica TaxID=69181 RepID=A0ABQ7CVC9_BRACR|nr:hypothetical protein DY000_02018966 [Brassica cretica]
MESDAGNSVARRRRRLSVVALSFVSLPLHVTLLLHEFLVGLGFLCSFAVAMCWRCCRCCHFIIWLLLSPSPSLLTALVPDLFHKTSTFSICYSQIPDLKLLGRVFPSSSPTTLNFLPSGKIDANWFNCLCGSRTSPPGSLFVRSMRLNGSKYYYQTIQTKFLLLSDHNDQWLDFGSVKSPGLQHGNAGVGCLCLESTPVHSEVCVKPISLSVGIKVKSSLTTNFFMVKIHSCNAAPARLLEWFICSVHKCQSLQAMKYMFVDSQQCSTPSSNLRLLKLGRNSPFKSSFEDEFNQISSRQGRERSFSTSSFSKERFFPPISLCIRGDPLPVFKTRKIYQCPSRLLSCVKVRLGPVDATILILMRVEVLDGAAMSYAIVTNHEEEAVPPEKKIEQASLALVNNIKDRQPDRDVASPGDHDHSVDRSDLNVDKEKRVEKEDRERINRALGDGEAEEQGNLHHFPKKSESFEAFSGPAASHYEKNNLKDSLSNEEHLSRPRKGDEKETEAAKEKERSKDKYMGKSIQELDLSD